MKKQSFSVEAILSENELQVSTAIDAVNDVTNPNSDDNISAIVEDVKKTEEAKADAEQANADDSNASGGDLNTDTPPTDAEPALTEEETAAVDAETAETKANANPEDAPSEEQVEATTDELDEKNGAMEDAASLATALEEMADILEGDLKYGGIRQCEVPLVETTVNKLYEVVTSSTEPVLSLSQENFTPTKRIKHSKIAIESIREQASKVWKMIVDFLSSIIKWISDKVSSLFSKTKQIRITIADYKKAVPLFTSVNNPTVLFEDKSVIRKITNTGLVHNPNKALTLDINDSILTFTTVSKIFSSNCLKAHEVINNAIEDSFNDSKDLKGRTGLLSGKNILGHGWNKVKFDIPGYRTPSTEGSVPESWLGPTLPGGIQLAAFLPCSELTTLEASKALSKCKIFFANNDDFNPPQTGADYLNDQNDILDALSSLNTLNDFIDKNIEELKKNITIKNKLISSIKNKISNFVSSTETDSVPKMCAQLSHGLSNLYDTPIINLNKIYFSFADASLHYVRASLQQGLKKAP